MKRILTIIDTIGTIAMTLAAIVFLVLFVTGRLGVTPGASVANARSAAKPAVEDIEQSGLTVAVPKASERHTGSPRIAIVEFSDFQCPYCGKYAREVYPDLVRDFVEAGKVEYAFKYFPLENIHSLALGAATAAACAASQGKFWDMHDLLFSNQQALKDSDLLAHGRALNLPEPAFSDCLGNSAIDIANDEREGRRLGVSSTPTFLLGSIQSDGTIKVQRRIAGARSYAVFKSALDELLTKPLTSRRG